MAEPIGFVVNFTNPVPAEVVWQAVRIVPANNPPYVDSYETINGYGLLGYGNSYGG